MGGLFINLKGSAGLKALINYALADGNAVRFCRFVWEEKKFPVVCLVVSRR